MYSPFPLYHFQLVAVGLETQQCCSKVWVGPCLSSLFPTPGRGMFSKALSSLDFLCSYHLFTLRFNSPYNKYSAEETPRLLRLHRSLFVEDIPEIQLCYVNNSHGLWHLVRS